MQDSLALLPVKAFTVLGTLESTGSFRSIVSDGGDPQIVMQEEVSRTQRSASDIHYPSQANTGLSGIIENQGS